MSKSSDFFQRFCENNIFPHEGLENYSIGWNKIQAVIWIIPLFAIILNLFSLIQYIRIWKKPK
jgi:hypothetical protein